MTETPVLIIGAGPAGLAVAARLRMRDLSFDIIEKSDQVGHSWHRHYDRLHLHTVRELSHLPGLPFPADYPRYVSRAGFVAYMEAYARHFGISPHFGQEARSARRDGTHWIVETAGGPAWRAGRVVFTTGVNRVPHEPLFPLQEVFQGRRMHSREYRNGKPFSGQEVLIIGMGNTGAEIALDLLEHGARPTISVRGAVNIVPRDLFGRPTQLTALQLARLPDWLGDAIARIVRLFTVGNVRRYGLEVPRMAPSRQLRLTGKTPVIDIGTLAAIKEGKIRVQPGIERFTAGGAIFENGREARFDTVILATGYKPALGDFLENISGLVDENGAPTTVIGTGGYEGLYFVGFDNYTPGGILGVINRDSEIVAAQISGISGA